MSNAMGKTRVKQGNKARPQRTRIGRGRDLLSVQEKDPNKVYRWVNDTGANIQYYQGLGYQFVPRKTVGKIGEGADNKDSTLGEYVTKEVGRRAPMTAYLMAIDKDLYNQGREEHEELIKEKEEAMFNDHQRIKQDGGYGDVSIDN